MAEFRMPSLGADMESGTLLEWRVKPGDPVKRGDIVAVVDTSKAEIEVEIFEDGVIDELLVEEGTRVPVGTALATVRTADGTAAEAAPGTAPRTAAETASGTAVETASGTAAETAPDTPTLEPAGAVAAPPPGPPPASPSLPLPSTPAPAGADRLRVSPVARRAAERLGVDLTAVHGTGPGGAIGKADVERATATAAPATAAAAPVAPAAAPRAETSGGEVKQAAMRQAIGALMARSKHEIPHYYLERQIEMSASLAWLTEQNLTRTVSERLLPAVLLLSAVARAARAMPEMNGFWQDGAFQPAAGVHLGVAVSLRGGGLVAPALHDADRLSLDELMAGLRDLVRRARAGVLRSSEMSDPTLTVTNLGEQGADLVHGVIYPPQVALVGFGAIRERPWAQDGMLAARPVVTATLAADHRAGDGHAGSRFLAAIERLLQAPEDLGRTIQRESEEER